MVHTLRLDNYSPTPRKLVLGTNSSYGTESIKIERGAGWDGLNLTATWHIPGREEPLRVALLDGDAHGRAARGDEGGQGWRACAGRAGLPACSGRVVTWSI